MDFEIYVSKMVYAAHEMLDSWLEIAASGDNRLPLTLDNMMRIHALYLVMEGRAQRETMDQLNALVLGYVLHERIMGGEDK